MHDPLSFEDIQARFVALGITDFSAALPEGRIQWLNRDGAVVAHGRCVAVLSYAGANQSIAWAEALPHFKEAHVPCVERPEGLPEYQLNITEAMAEQLASRVARNAGAVFLYPAKTGQGGILYLGITEFAAVEASPVVGEA
jgi:hypothetical protein